MSQRPGVTDDAAAIGRQRGRDAAAWVFNGTASADDLAGYAGTRPCGEDQENADVAYQEAASTAFWDELERLCRSYLDDAAYS
jgi:hypothetical protein